MTLKRILIIVLFLGLIPAACWNKDVQPHTRLGDMSVQSFQDKSLTSQIIEADAITDSIIYFKLNSKATFISSLPKFDFINTSYAFRKAKPGYDGLKVKLSDIRITSDNLFNGNAEGTNLKTYFGWIFFDDEPDNSIDKLMTELNEDSDCLLTGNDYFKFVMNAKPTDSLSHRFTFDFIYVDGTVQSATSEKLTWE